MNNHMIIKKANELLNKCSSIELSSIDENGYPHICEMEKVKADDFLIIYFTTPKRTKKVKHFLKNNKGGVCFSSGDDSVSLSGDVEIIEDIHIKRYIWVGMYKRCFGVDNQGNHKNCILRFKTLKGTFYIDGEKVLLEF